MSDKVDLRHLVVNRESPPAAPRPGPAGGGHLLTRVLLPGVLLAGFLALLGYAARESLASPRRVTVVPVLLSHSSLPRSGGEPLFRAAGWVEPRPSPVLVTALAEGAVAEVLVVEGQEVKAGAPVARLVEADARLALDAALADVSLREGELAAARAAARAARDRFENPLHLQADLAEAEASLARAETDLANLPNLLAGARARQRLAKGDLDAREQATASVSEA